MFSRFGQQSRGTRSFYEELRGGEGDFDVEDEAGLNLDEDNLRHQFNDAEAEVMLGADSRITVDSAGQGGKSKASTSQRSRRAPFSKWPAHDEDADNDVPASLLIEPNEVGALHDTPDRVAPSAATLSTRPPQTQHPSSHQPSGRSREQWEAATAQQQLHEDDIVGPQRRSHPRDVMTGTVRGGRREKALWRWVNTSNLDSFMRDVYDYYEGGGLWCILSSNALWLL